jgi:hypothetical protein
MSESAKTGLFGLIALVAIVVSLLARPAAPGGRNHDDSGERFFQTFDPLHATSLEIIGHDQDAIGVAGFKVAQIDGVWSIPSHDNYPADAADQLARAAASIADLIKGTTVSDNPSDHAMYGVVDPADMEAGASGVGTRVTMRDRGNAVLVDLIVGQSVKDAPELRYVRIPGRDRVYTSKLATDRLTTEFENWIEDDLLQLNPEDVVQITINDYSVDEVNQRLIEGERVQLDYRNELARWFMAGLGPDQVLKKDKVREITQALDDLRVVDVYRKPSGLSAELRAAQDMELDSQSIQSLRQRGFFISEGRLLSNEGETIIKLSSGIMYVLRFGEIARPRRTAGAIDEATAETTEDQDGARYLFIMARFDPTMIPEPEYETVPEDTGENGAERQRILAANEKKLDDWEQQVVDGEARVHDLNARFADWYYVIPDSVYRDIRLKRNELIDTIESPEAATAPSQPGDVDNASR